MYWSQLFLNSTTAGLMIEDRYLVWKLNRGSADALSRIYEKCRDDLLRLATAMLNDKADAEDIVHEVFVRFAESAGDFQLTGSLKGYLATCVANRARNRNSSKQRRADLEIKNILPPSPHVETPDRWIINSEELEIISHALASIPGEQREVITLRLYSGMKFREIARLQDTSIKTIQSRYRSGLDKLRSILGGGSRNELE
jgi:RNA polymerase sigma-70 factor (ECF subfamily)